MATVIRVFTDHQVGGDAVDCHPTWRPQSSLATSLLLASATRALIRLPASDIAHFHLSERGSFVREGLLVALARRRGLLTVATIHGASFHPFARRHLRLVSAVLRHAHLITCLDPETLVFLRRSVPAVRSELVPNPVVIDGSFPPADGTRELVIFAGEIGRRKGADILCSAWPLVASRRPDARCLIVGPVTDFIPPEIERLEVRSAATPSEMKMILQSARVVALPSRAEALPMILCEAMSEGRPFVGTPVGGIAELAAAGGMLVEVGDEIGLADRLTTLLANAGLARTLGERGRQFVQETRSVAVVDARFRDLYAGQVEA